MLVGPIAIHIMRNSPKSSKAKFSIYLQPGFRWGISWISRRSQPPKSGMYMNVKFNDEWMKLRNGRNAP